jgi:hypothetical protein
MRAIIVFVAAAVAASGAIDRGDQGLGREVRLTAQPRRASSPGRTGR